jgi:hypothetical protein
MKLDPDLFRNLLLYFESVLPEQTPNLWASEIDSPKYSSMEVIYHVGLLADCGYIFATPIHKVDVGSGKGVLAYERLLARHSPNFPPDDDYFIERLTYDGHQFIELTKNETIWKKYREIAKSLGIEAIKQAIPIILDVVKKQAGLL